MTNSAPFAFALAKSTLVWYPEISNPLGLALVSRFDGMALTRLMPVATTARETFMMRIGLLKQD